MEAEVGMLVVETIAKIRRAYFVDGHPIKAICRELGVSSEGGPQGYPFSSNRVPVRTRDAAAPEDGAVEFRA